MDVAKQIAKLNQKCVTYRDAKNAFQRNAALTFAVATAKALMVHRDALTARMDAYGAYAAAQDGPEDDASVDAWIADLHAYETIQDALDDAAHLAWPADGKRAA